MIDPVLLKLGAVEIRYYGILFALAFLMGYYLAKKLSKEFDIEEKKIEDLTIYMLIAIIIGARLFEVLFYDFSYYISNPIKIFYIWEGGLASHGALIALILLVYFYSKKHNLSFYKIADLFIIPISLGAAFVRLGNFFNSELVGKITSVSWAVKFNNFEGLRHPVQLYQSFYYVLIFFVLYLNRRNKKDGTLFWGFIFLDGIFRFITEFFKDLPPSYGFEYLGLNLAQYAALIMILVSIKSLFSRIKNHQDKHF